MMEQSERGGGWGEEWTVMSVEKLQGPDHIDL